MVMAFLWVRVMLLAHLRGDLGSIQSQMKIVRTLQPHNHDPGVY